MLRYSNQLGVLIKQYSAASYSVANQLLIFFNSPHAAKRFEQEVEARFADYCFPVRCGTQVTLTYYLNPPANYEATGYCRE